MCVCVKQQQQQQQQQEYHRWRPAVITISLFAYLSINTVRKLQSIGQVQASKVYGSVFLGGKVGGVLVVKKWVERLAPFSCIQRAIMMDHDGIMTS
jgi:hypothetical protein